MRFVVALIFAGVGTAILAWTGVNFVYAILSRAWPQAMGTVIASRLRRSRDSEDGYAYWPEVSYRYTVDGHEFVGSRTRFGDRMSLSWSGVVRIVGRYKVGMVIPVHYDPADPRDVVLEPGVNGLLFAAAALGCVLIVVGILAMPSGP